jgi:ATP adenylyltransferase
MILWQQMGNVAERAMSLGKLVSIPSSFEIIEDGGIPFVVRYAPELIQKIRATAKSVQSNPFLPPEPELTVCAIGEDHQLILNKFNVLKTHALLTTNQFVSQTDQLSLSDFNAISTLLDEVDGFVFYNGGEQAGASQSHRHFQLVPKDMGSGSLPVETVIENCKHHEQGDIFPFEHRLYWLPNTQGETLWDAWQKLEYVWQPYNLLITRQWMLVVPRSVESFQQMSVNSLGFAGALLAKNKVELDAIRTQGPLTILGAVACPK